MKFAHDFKETLASQGELVGFDCVRNEVFCGGTWPCYFYSYSLC